MEFIEEIVRVKKPASKLIESLAEQYSAISFKFGYFEAQSPCWLYLMRKDGAAVAFELQFGNISEFKASLERLNKSGAQLCFFITSSLSHTMRLEAVRGLLLRNFQIKEQKFMIIDIETGRSLKANFEWGDFEQGMESRKTGGSERNSGGGNERAGSGGRNGESGQSVQSGQERKPLFREARRKKIIYGRRGEHKEQD